MDIIPAILTKDPAELVEKMQRVEGLARLAEGDPRRIQRVQIDIVDGVFADNKTITLDMLASIETNLLLDVQLMTKEPALWVEHAVRALADRIIGHVEMMGNQRDFVVRVQETGHLVGLGLDLDTPVVKIEEDVLLDLDVVLLMSVKAGFGGQEFQNSVLPKTEELVALRQKLNTAFAICVDGGINEENIKRLQDCGADEVAIGSSLFEGDIQENLEKLRKALE